MSIILKAIKREAGENLNSKIKEGFVPGVYYGPQNKSVTIYVVLNEFLKVLRKAGESTVVSLEAEGGEIVPVLIHEVNLDPITDKPRHIDFYVFEKGKKITVSIPVEFIGVSPAVKELGGIMVKVVHELEVESEPSKLPHKIEIDVSILKDFESQILAQDIKLPEGVSLMIEPEEVIASIVAPKEEVEESATEVDLSEIEVEKKGKKEEEGGEENKEKNKEQK